MLEVWTLLKVPVLRGTVTLWVGFHFSTWVHSDIELPCDLGTHARLSRQQRNPAKVFWNRSREGSSVPGRPAL